MAEAVFFCAAGSDAGKTTLVLRLLDELGRRGIAAAVLKHGEHRSPCAGKDSARCAAAGAAGTLLVTPEGWTLDSAAGAALTPERAVELLRGLTGCALVLGEGWKAQRAFPKLAVCRAGVASALPCPEAELAAVVGDAPPGCGLPRFDAGDAAGICDFLLSL